MDRETIMLTQRFTKIHLGTLIDNYGPELIAGMIPKVYRFQYPMWHSAARNWENGRPWHHVNKTTGLLRKKYKGTNLKKVLVAELSQIGQCNFNAQFMYNIRTLQRFMKQKYKQRYNAAVLIQKYVRRYYVRLCKMKAQQMIDENIDFATDIITTEKLIRPCVILPDYKQGNFVFYNKSTIDKMVKSQKIPVFTYLNELTMEEELVYRHIVEKDIFGNLLYKSPFTRIDFTKEDVLDLKNNLIFQFGQRLTYFQNRR